MKYIIILAIIAVLGVIGISTILGPDDLSSCQARPTQSAGQLCGPVDAVVAVSGGDTVNRAGEAITLYQNGWAEKIVFSGAALDTSGPSNAAVMAAQAEQSGVPVSAIYIDENSETTAENATNSMKIFDENQITSVIVVTSAYHQRRAGLEFSKRSGGDMTIRNHPVNGDNQWSPNWWWATPIGWFLAVSELSKIIIFYSGGSR